MINTAKTQYADDEIRYYWEPLFGPGPYRFHGCTEETYQACPGAPTQPGTSCDVCGQGIRYVAWFTTPDGARFKTGLDCAEKSGRKDVIGAIRKAKRALDKQHRQDLARRKLGASWYALGAQSETLRAKPHPYQWARDKGLSLYDWAEWMLSNGGDKGRGDVYRMLNKIIVD